MHLSGLMGRSIAAAAIVFATLLMSASAPAEPADSPAPPPVVEAPPPVVEAPPPVVEAPPPVAVAPAGAGNAIQAGDVAVTGFSGTTLATDKLPTGIDPLDRTLID